MHYTHNFYNKIYIFPDEIEGTLNQLVDNIEIIDINKDTPVNLTLKEKMDCVRIVLSDFIYYPEKSDFLKAFRYNLSLIKQLYIKAKMIALHKDCFIGNTIVYAYWADNLATKGAILLRSYFPTVKLVTRGHGYEIFEIQTLYNLIPFRKFQYQYASKIFADSKKGYEHLNAKPEFRRYKEKNEVSYVGTKDMGIGPFDSAVFNIATCSFVSSIKRLHLLPQILHHIDFNLTWHILGDGPELDHIKKLTEKLPANIKMVYHGQMENQEILYFYKNTPVNLLVSLSYSEGLPVSLMEALSFGIPIMSTDVGGCKEICNDQTGFLIEKDFDPKTVAEEMKRFKSSNKNSAVFHQKCREYWTKNFNAETNYKNFANQLLKLN